MNKEKIFKAILKLLKEVALLYWALVKFVGKIAFKILKFIFNIIIKLRPRHFDIRRIRNINLKHVRLQTWVALGLIFVLLPIVAFSLYDPGGASAEWADNSYSFRQQFTFTHNANINDYRSITFTLDTAELITAGVMQSNCEDTRFTSISGELLRYDITGTCNNASTTYEVIFSKIVNGTNVGYVYYGNPGAVDDQIDSTVYTALTPSGGDPSAITDRTNEEKGRTPAGWWSFNEGYGDSSTDMTRNSNNATMTAGSAITDVEKYINIISQEDANTAGSPTTNSQLGEFNFDSSLYNGDTAYLEVTAKYDGFSQYSTSPQTGGTAIVYTVDQLDMDCSAGTDDCKMVFLDATNESLIFKDCDDANCVSGTTTVIDGATGCSLTNCSTTDAILDVNSSNLAGELSIDCSAGATDCKIAYYNDTDTSLQFADCDDATCSSGTIEIVDGNTCDHTNCDSADDVGRRLSLDCSAGATDCKIAYHNDTNSSLMFADCSDATCSGGTVEIVDGDTCDHTSCNSADDVGERLSMDCSPGATDCKIAYYSSTNTGLYFADCSDATCSGGTINIIDGVTSCVLTGCDNTYATAAFGPSLECPATDDCKMTYVRGTGSTYSGVFFADCADATCSSGNAQLIDGETGCSLTNCFDSLYVGSQSDIDCTGGATDCKVIYFFNLYTGEEVGLFFADCDSATCNSGTTTHVDLLHDDGAGNYACGVTNCRDKAYNSGYFGMKALSCFSATDCKFAYAEEETGTIYFADCSSATCSTGEIKVSSGTFERMDSYEDDYKASMYCVAADDCKIVVISLSTRGASTTYRGVSEIYFIDCNNVDCTSYNKSQLEGRYCTIGDCNSGFRNDYEYSEVDIYCVATDDCKIVYVGDWSKPYLWYIDCFNERCSEGTKNAVDGASASGLTGADTSGEIEHPSIYCVATDDCKISYHLVDTTSLRFADCDDAYCSSGNISNVDGTTCSHTGCSSGDDNGNYSSIYCIATDDCKISYYSTTDTALYFADCSNSACSAGTVSAVDGTTCSHTGCNSGDFNGTYTSLYCPAGDDCKISYYSGSKSALYFADCGATDCSSGTVSAVDGTTCSHTGCNSGDSNGNYSSIYCVSTSDCKISYYSATDTAIYFADCDDATCSSGTVTLVDGASSCALTGCDSTRTAGNYLTYIDCVGGTSDCKVIYSDNTYALLFGDCGSSTCSSGEAVSIYGKNDNVSAVRLFASDGSYVSGSELNFSSSTYTTKRTSALSLSTGSYTIDSLIYGVNEALNQDSISADITVKSARLVITQSDTSITDTETQIEIGSYEATTSTSATALTDPKYFQYDNDQYGGTVNAYFEATIRGTATTTSTFSFIDVTGSSNTDLSWASNGSNITDQLNTTFGTSDGNDDNRLLNQNTCDPECKKQRDTITKVEVRVHGCQDAGDNGWLSLTPYFGSYVNGASAGDVHAWSSVPQISTDCATDATWSAYYDITSDTNAPSTWTWNDVSTLDMILLADKQGGADIMHASEVEIRVTHYGAAGTANAELYNRTDGAVVTNSAISTTSGSWERVRGASALSTNWDTSNDDEYEVRIYAGSTNQAEIANAKIIIQQTDAGGLSKTESVIPLVTHVSTDTDSTYTDQDFIVQFTPSNYSPTPTAYFESTIKTSAGTGYAQGWNDSDSSALTASEVTTTSTSYGRQRSSSATMPSATKNIDTQLKNSATNTTTVSDTHILLQQNTGAGSGTTPTWYAHDDCVVGKCIHFNGSNNIAGVVTNATAIDMNDNLASALTFQSWVRVNSDGESNVGEIFEKGASTYLRTTNEGSDSFVDLEASLDLATTPATATVTNGLTIGKWHLVTMVYTDDGDDEIDVYIDGILQASSTNGVGSPDTDANDLNIGGSTDATFHGFIDEFKIYPYARTAAEIQTDYLKTSTLAGAAAAFDEDKSFLTDGLLGYWKLEDVTDSSGSGFDLTNNGTTTFVSGKFGNGSEHVPASSQYLSYGTTVNNIQTVSFWTNPDSTTTNFFQLTGSDYLTSSSGTLSSTGFGSSEKVYVNGVESTTIAADEWQFVTITTDTSVDASAFEIGRANSSYYDGTLDDFRIYNREFSPAEVQSLYNSAPGPVAHYKLDENLGTSTTYDESGNGFNGTLTSITNDSWVPGKYGSALQLDGSADYVDVGTGPTTVNTVEFWAYPATDTEYFVNLTSTTDYIAASGGTLTPTGFTSPSVYIDGVYQGATGTIVANKWQHVAVTTATAENASNFDIGRTADANYLQGKIDDVRLYDYVRTSAQIVEDMNGGHPIGGSPVGSQVVYYKFDENSGTTVNNAVAANESITGSITGATWTSSSSCQYNNCLDFDGIDDVVTASSTTAIDDIFDGGGTITAWVNADSFGTYGRIVDKNTVGSPNGWGLSTCDDNGVTYCDNTLLFWNTTDANAGIWTTPTNSFNTGSWYHIAVTYDTDTLTTAPKVYINGVKQTMTQNQAPTGNDTSDAGEDLYIGDRDASDLPFDGSIDDFKIYSSELSAAEVLIDMNANAAINFGTGTDEGSDDVSMPDPVGYWPMNENTGTSTTYDKSGNGYDGTLTGSMTEDDWVPGYKGSALDFDGSDDEALISVTGTNPYSSDTFSISAWIYKTSDSGSNEIIFSNEEADNDGFRMYIAASSNDDLACSYNSTDASNTTNFLIPLNKWTHVACTSSGTELKTYVNGFLTEPANAITGNIAVADNSDASIGGSAFASTGDFPGYIDEVKVWTSELSQKQIAYDFSRGRPIVHLKLDECQGSTAYNAGVPENDATITITGTGDYTSTGTCDSGTGTEAWNAGSTGKRNSGLGLDGTNDSIALAELSDDNYDFGNSSSDYPFSLAVWVKMDDATSFPIISKIDTVYGYLFQSDSSDYLSLRLYDNSSGNYIGQRSTNTITGYEGSWAHVVATYSGSGAASGIKLYVNGESVDLTADSAGSYTAMENHAADVVIGRDAESGSVYANGTFDDVRMYNYELSQAQIGKIMNDDAGTRFGPDEGSP